MHLGQCPSLGAGCGCCCGTCVLCVGWVTPVSDYFYVLLWHPVEGLGSGDLWDVKTQLCVAEGKR